MATKIVTKNSSTASAVPTASDLVQGELAVNVADKRLFTEDNGGSIVELGTNPSTIDINAGTIDGTAIGASSASTGAFTTLTATGAFTSRGIDDNADATAITIDSSENVGIGASSPSSYHAPADNLVIGSSGDNGLTIASGTSSGGTICFADGTSGGAQFAGFIDYQHNGDYMRFGTNVGTERMRIDSNGVLQSNGYSLVASSARAASGTLRLGNIASTSMLLDYDDQSQTIATVRNQYGSTANAAELSLDSGFITFNTGTSFTERMRIDASGNVGIGSSSTDGRLKVSAASGASGAGSIALYGNNGSGFGGSNVVRSKIESKTDGTAFGANMLFYTNDTSNAYQERMRIDSSGNLSVGDSNAYTHRLFVKGVGTNEAVGLGVGTNGNNIIRFYNSGLGTAGAITVASGGTTVAYNTSSDQRLKENIADADDAGSKIDSIQVRKYDWKADGSHQDYGMIAQELQAVAPEAVSGDADSEDMMGVDYSKLVPMMLKEIQSLRNRVAQLEG